MLMIDFLCATCRLPEGAVGMGRLSTKTCRRNGRDSSSLCLMWIRMRPCCWTKRLSPASSYLFDDADGVLFLLQLTSMIVFVGG